MFDRKVNVIKTDVLCTLDEYAFIFTSYLLAKPGLNCLKAAALEFACEILHPAMIVILPKITFHTPFSKIGIKHVFSTIF